MDKRLTKNNILSIISEHEIFEYYLGHPVDYSTLYKSPFREEKGASFNVYTNMFTNRPYFKDFGNGWHGDCFQLVQYLIHSDFIGALSDVAREFSIDLDKVNKKKAINYTEEKTVAKKIRWVDIECEIQPYQPRDLEYWNSYGRYSKRKLKFYDIYSVKRFWMNNYLSGTYTTDNPIYGIRVNNRWKIYRPFDEKDNKFRSNLTSTDIAGLKQLPETGELCILTKSIKDIGCLHSFLLPAVSFLSENTLPPNGFIKYLKTRYPKIITYYDNDKTGIDSAKMLYDKYNIMYIHNPIDAPKDVSDFYYEYGHESTEQLIQELIYGG